jgi:hypothetical protein
VFGGVGGGAGAAFGGFGARGEAAIGGAGDLARGELGFHWFDSFVLVLARNAGEASTGMRVAGVEQSLGLKINMEQ